MSFVPESEIGLKLKSILIPEIQRRYGKTEDDSQDIADYLMYLIASNKPHDEIINEIKDIAEIPIDGAFINDVLVEIQKLQQGDQTIPEPSQTPDAEVMMDEGEPRKKINIPTAPQNMRSQMSEQERRELRSQRFGTKAKGRGGVSKPASSGRSERHNNNLKRNFNDTKKIEQALDMIGNSGVKILNNFVVQAPKGRCPDFPYCENKECEKAHPTKNCFAYPKCPNPPGTCNFLHPDQDQELIAKLEQSKKEFQEKRTNKILVEQGGCKFGAKCTKDSCPFAHPTPANPNAIIETLEWCSEGKNCVNEACTKSHPPPPTATAVPAVSAAEIALEQCKFGTQCTNYKCPRRHATSSVPCRSGSDCRRLDCTFAHAMKEACRFGAKCTNRNCMYQHPEGRTITSNTWSKDNNDASTTNRSFAVPEDQVMEQAVQQ
ncbi:Nuclear polyadenylated RNA-binding protein NAB2 [Spathaspora sp. JA1]|nr:Nuclear polyadenylated RNA-binding protein NAB2 [Spathaspora sp. JA1]